MTHSWKLLSDAEREAIEALSVFDSPVSRHLAEEVAAISAVTLRSLIDKSLLRRDPGGRHSSHPLVSQYAASRLAADEARRQTVRHRHAQAVLTRLGPNQALDHKELLDDGVQAWNHAVEHKDLELLAASAEGVTLLLEASGQCRRGLDLLRRADEAAEGHEAAQDRIRALSRVNQARLLQHLGEHEMAAEAARAALEGGNEVEDPRVQVMARLDLGWAEKWIQGDEAQYRSTMEALPLAEVLGDRILLAEVRNGLGCSAPTLEECKRHLLAALSLVDSATREDLRSVILCNLGNVCWGLGDIREAIESLEKALTVARDHGSTLRNLDDLIDLAFFRAEAGDLEGALALADEAESVDEDSEFLVKSAYLAVVAGEIHERAGDLDGARKRMGRALRLAKSIGNEPFALRALRLRGLLLMDQGEQDDGLGVLAFVLPRAGRRGDFTSEILNPRIWAERTESIDPERVHRATQWAEDQTLDGLVNKALAEVIQTSVR
ncbi:MAG: tetratricopeptide repeat protein [Acidimicrobiia bacterium]